MAHTTPLADVPTQDLIDELMRRPGIVASIWTTEDVTPFLNDDDAEDRADLTDEQIEQIATAFLDNVNKDLQEVLASRGNDFLSDRWTLDREELIDPSKYQVF